MKKMQQIQRQMNEDKGKQPNISSEENLKCFQSLHFQTRNKSYSNKSGLLAFSQIIYFTACRDGWLTRFLELDQQPSTPKQKKMIHQKLVTLKNANMPVFNATKHGRKDSKRTPECGYSQDCCPQERCNTVIARPKTFSQKFGQGGYCP